MKVSFFPFLLTPTGRIFRHIRTLNTALYVVPAKEVPFGGYKDESLNLTPFTPKNVKIGTKLAVNGKFLSS